MKLTGLHLLLTYQCTFECDHCFVWGSPRQSGVFTLKKIKDVLKQASDTGTIRTIYFEGGEPFLYYPILLRGIRIANRMKFQTGIVTNGYWATTTDDAREWLKPFEGLVQRLSISSDLYHYNEKLSRQAQNAVKIAKKLGIMSDILTIIEIDSNKGKKTGDKKPTGESDVMFRGRAAEKLAGKVQRRNWTDFTTCPYENLRTPSRVHVDPFGNVHVCQGISIGNLFQTPLKQISEEYQPDTHPVAGHLLRGGPAELIRYYNLAHRKFYADACHTCYDARTRLRRKLPNYLLPDQMYGVK